MPLVFDWFQPRRHLVVTAIPVVRLRTMMRTTTSKANSSTSTHTTSHCTRDRRIQQKLKTSPDLINWSRGVSRECSLDHSVLDYRNVVLSCLWIREPCDWRVVSGIRVSVATLLSQGDYPANIKHLYDICTMLDQRRRRWAHVVQMLYKCFVFAGYIMRAKPLCRQIIVPCDKANTKCRVW